MFREMRRKDKAITKQEISELLKKGEFGVLGTLSTNGYPYTTPVNYVYYNEKIYFHCAVDGEKVDNMTSYNKVSFCVIDDVELLPSEFSTKYSSVILFGRAKEVLEEEKEAYLLALVEKYSGDFVESGKKYIKNSQHETKVFKIEIEHITGKAQK